jgi:elongation factor P--beta-lysine ligase
LTSFLRHAAMTKMPHVSPWWHRAVHADRRPFLLARNRIVAALRRWFEQEGFVEVEAGRAAGVPRQ